jgi:hypothetical protein
MRSRYIQPPLPADPRRPGALVISRSPVEGETLALRDVLPTAGDEYQGMVERTWHDDDGRLWVRFAAPGADSNGREESVRGAVFEVWLRREREPVQRL